MTTTTAAITPTTTANITSFTTTTMTTTTAAITPITNDVPPGPISVVIATIFAIFSYFFLIYLKKSYAENQGVHTLLTGPMMIQVYSISLGHKHHKSSAMPGVYSPPSCPPDCDGWLGLARASLLGLTRVSWVGGAAPCHQVSPRYTCCESP